MARTKTETWATYRPTNHAKHIFWSIMTAGAWAITGYPICHAINKRRARAVTVKTTEYHGYGRGRDRDDEYGPPPQQDYDTYR